MQQPAGPAEWHLAQLNVARAVAPLESPALADFMGALDRINALAEQSDGFVWRLTGASGNATDVRPADDPDLLVNLTVWRSAEALFDFTYRTAHVELMRRRRDWFEAPAEAYLVLWWIPAGHVPSVDEALARLAHLRAHGPTAQAFTFKRRFPPPGGAAAPDDMEPERYCGPM